MSLYLKYRPKSLDEVKGNSVLKQTLDVMLSNKSTCPHTFMLTGPTGCGKTTIARIIANRLGAKGNDLRELDSAQFRGIDTVRDIRGQAQFKPLEGDCIVWILDELQKMTGDGMSALLKILEDTPDHVYFILCTTDPQKVIKTIHSRCSTFQVYPLNEIQMFALLRTVIRGENESLEKDVYQQIFISSGGPPRTALQILEQVLKVPPEERLEAAKHAEILQTESIELCRALIRQAGWKAVSTILKGLKEEDPEGIRRHVLGYCGGVLLNGENNIAGRLMEEFLAPTYNTGFNGIIYACYAIVKN